MSVASAIDPTFYTSDMFWSRQNRAISLICQPLKQSHKCHCLSVVGSQSCLGTYINTIYEDTSFNIPDHMVPHYLEVCPDYLQNPRSMFNCVFEEKAGNNYVQKWNTFGTFDSFKTWVEKSTIRIMALRNIKEGEELFVDYNG